MPSIDFDQLMKDMLSAGKDAAEDGWPAIRDFAKNDLKTLAELAIQIEADKIAGTITENGAKVLLEMNRNAVETVLVGTRGVAKLVAERVVNAVLGVVKNAIRAATGFNL